MRLMQKHRVTHTLRQGEALLCQIPRRVEPPLSIVKGTESHQHRKALPIVSELLAQGVRSVVHCRDFERFLALDHEEWWAQGKVQGQFVLHPFGRVRQTREYLQPFREVPDRRAGG